MPFLLGTNQTNLGTANFSKVIDPVGFFQRTLTINLQSNECQGRRYLPNLKILILDKYVPADN